MESLEGKRGYPRIRPPFPAVVGLYGSPTVINNVETLSSAPEILRRGGEWYAGLGSPKNGGTRLFCISGPRQQARHLRIADGLSTLRQMIEDVAGGMLNGKKLKAVIPGRQFLPAADRG
jgi:NADH-quinone oxidoreductase subunit F